VVVGFGENTVGSEQKNQFSLSNALPSVMKRNFAPIDSLNVAPASYTPLRQLIGSNSAIAKQIFEFSGSGLCGSKDGSNYDTGAAVYVDGKFAGFSVRSTTISAGYKGQLRDCSKVYGKDIATLAVGLTRDQIEKFKAGVAARK
ncbi:MAG: hypothetical protein NTV34_00475, partial [Proteobacteria bacterium]|nr:hypothetical protein [Pseudomonadota bacterium]